MRYFWCIDLLLILLIFRSLLVRNFYLAAFLIYLILFSLIYLLRLFILNHGIFCIFYWRGNFIYLILRLVLVNSSRQVFVFLFFLFSDLIILRFFCLWHILDTYMVYHLIFLFFRLIINTLALFFFLLYFLSHQQLCHRFSFACPLVGPQLEFGWFGILRFIDVF